RTAARSGSIPETERTTARADVRRRHRDAGVVCAGERRAAACHAVRARRADGQRRRTAQGELAAGGLSTRRRRSWRRAVDRERSGGGDRREAAIERLREGASRESDGQNEA